MIRINHIPSKCILGSALAAVAALFPLASAHAKKKETVLYSFQGGSDGAMPWASLIEDSAGNFYGTTNKNGTYSCDHHFGCGTVFKLARDGGETVLHSFRGKKGTDSYAGLITDSAGNLYGTTRDGGGSADCYGGCGTVFKIAPDGAETVLYSFQGGNDGANPYAGLIADSAGNLYGTTLIGGPYCHGKYQDGCGTVFKVAPDGAETVLYSFQGRSDGAFPWASLIEDSAGNLYGTTEFTGDYSGSGTVFKVAPDGAETVLYSFQGGNDGGGPYAGLIADSAGNLYGTTGGGGGTGCDGHGCGTVFKVASDGTETVLYSFQGGNDGYYPYAGLIADSAGNLYGTTYVGGGMGCEAFGCGTVFKVAPDGTETVLYAFQGGNDGAEPYAGLIADSAGNLYGTTYEGGSANCFYGCGTIFKIAR